MNSYATLRRFCEKVCTEQGREPGRSPRAEGERMSADEHKQHDCNHKVIARSFKNAHAHKIHTKLMHIEVFCNLLQSSF